MMDSEGIICQLGGAAMTIRRLFTLSGVLMLSGANAAVLVSENFDYADGALTDNPAWGSHSGTAGTLPVSGGAALVTQDSGSEDANIGFSPVSSGVLTAEFDVIVTAPAAMTGTDFEYFAHFYTDGSFNFRSRLDVVAPVAGGDYSFGIASGSSTAEATLPIDFSFGATVPVSLSFDIDSGIASFSAGGETIQATGVYAEEVLDRFALRQSNSSSDETISVDNLVISGDVAAVPEPSTALLGGLALLGLIRRRRS